MITALEQVHRDFANNQKIYVERIKHHLENFIESYVASTLQALTLGFSPSEIINDLNEDLALDIARRIYTDLDRGIRSHVSTSIMLYQQQLRLARNSISATLDMKKVTNLTQRFIQKYGWDFLKPLIEQTIYSMFSQQFESQAKKSFSHWLRLAAAREVIRPLSNISTMLPTIFEEQLYSEQIMFGATPFRQALDRAAARFIEDKYSNHKKVLLIISDGEFREEAEVMVSANLLKRRGIKIISCLIHDRNLLAQLIKQPPHKWPTGAQRMLKIASEISDQDVSQVLASKRHLSRTLVENKLCFQINNSIFIDEIVENIFEGDNYNPAKDRDSGKYK